MSNDSTALATPNKEIGSNIIESAKELRRKRFSDKVVAIADRELEAVAVAEKKIEFYKQCAELSKKRLAAIENSEFTIERGEFAFTDESLRTGPQPFSMSESLIKAGDAFNEFHRTLEQTFR